MPFMEFSLRCRNILLFVNLIVCHVFPLSVCLSVCLFCLFCSCLFLFVWLVLFASFAFSFFVFCLLAASITQCYVVVYFFGGVVFFPSFSIGLLIGKKMFLVFFRKTHILYYSCLTSVLPRTTPVQNNLFDFVQLHRPNNL